MILEQNNIIIAMDCKANLACHAETWKKYKSEVALYHYQCKHYL